MGSGRAYGPIIAKSFSMIGDGTVKYDPTKNYLSPFPDGESITNPNDLIALESPVRENKQTEVIMAKTSRQQYQL